MARRRAPRDDVTDDGLRVSKPPGAAAGLPGVYHGLQHAEREMGLPRSLTTLRRLNQQDGFDCPSCAWPDPPHRHRIEFCENGAKATAWEADILRVPSEFWAEHSVKDLAGRTEYWLGQQGRLVEPVYKPADSDHYRPLGWDEAFEVIARHLKALDSPNEATFYTSGRTSNEAAFLYQLFVRSFGTNNLPDCSNMCHESTGVALAESIGVGKSSVSYEDFAKADLIIVMGQNPGTNHPRMLTALEEAKHGGTSIVAINPLPEPGLMRFKNPQRPSGVIGRGTALADQFLQVRLGGDMALLQAVAKRVIAADDRDPGSVLDQAFIDEHTIGLDAYRAHLAGVSDEDVLEATGLRSAEIDELALRYIASNATIVTWAMGLTQHKHAVVTIQEIVNLLLLRGNIGKPGAGASPIRGHSNVQGDRTMGIWERPPAAFIDAMEREFGLTFPREPGVDVVDAVRGMRDGRIKVFLAVGGNFVAATSDTVTTEAALRRTRLSVQVSTKLNHSHGVTGEEALILPTLGRTEIDRQASGEQFVTVEDTVCRVHLSHGRLEPASADLLSEVAIIARLARAVLGNRGDLPWEQFVTDYDTIRDRIARVIPGCDDYNAKVRRPNGFVLPHPPRDERRFPTKSGKAEIVVNDLEWPRCPPGRLLLQTVRSQDQFNTTIYGLDDRYRGVRKGRRVVFVNPDDLAELGFTDGDIVDLHSEWNDGVDRIAEHFRVIAFPTARGCAAAYFPEANPLVALDSQADRSGTPASKAIILRLEPARSHTSLP
ncbi:MAG TPA: FdhF/YdeP family oxidoreductase [Mycobacteriales bacterium]|nr:FdhF/YdeP family oxidoreductase [Mycobacteriales bacterium]